MEGRGGAGQSLRKHLGAVGIVEWGDLSRSALYDLADHLRETLAPSTAKTVMAYAKSLLHRYEDEVDLPAGWEKILQAKGAAPMKTYLTEDELRRFADAPVHTYKQTLVKNLFLVCAYTGLRVSDAMNLTSENIVDGCIRFSAKKTKKVGCIPMKKGLDERIKWISEHKDMTVTIAGYNTAVRKMAKDAGIDTEVVVVKGGKERRGPKWMFLSSHSARSSCATNLVKRGASVLDTCRLLQHSGTAQTMRYLVDNRVELSERAMAFFG